MVFVQVVRCFNSTRCASASSDSCRSYFGSPGGTLHCPQGGNAWGATLTAAGDVVEAQSSCARYADGVVRCFVTPAGMTQSVLREVTTDVVSLSDALWPLAMPGDASCGRATCTASLRYS